MTEEIEQAIKEFQEATWAFWCPDSTTTPPCIQCSAPAVCLHEIDPKSMNREWYKHGPEDSIPLCDPCHQKAGADGDAGEEVLRTKAVKRLQSIEDWKKSRVIREIESNGT